MEINPSEAVLNNVMEQKYYRHIKIIRSRSFVLISTDKAVNPVNIMGASKHCIRTLSSIYNSEFKNEVYNCAIWKCSPVQNGSVIPRFKEQIEKGGPVTVTHPDVIRYFHDYSGSISVSIAGWKYGEKGDFYFRNGRASKNIRASRRK